MYQPRAKTSVTFVRYWGSFFKSLRQANIFACLFEPLVRRGWDCYLVLEALPDEGSWVSAFREMGVKPVILPRARGNFDLKCAARAFALCRRTRADVFHCDNMHTSPLMGAFLARARVRIWTKHSMSAHYEAGRKPTVRDRLALATRTSGLFATRIFAVSTAVQKELSGLGIPEHRVVVRHNPRMLSEAQLAYDRVKARQELRFGDAEKVIVTVGHAVPVKGWDLLVHAFRQVSKQEPCARLVLVGSFAGKHERGFYDHLQNLITANNLQSRITFTGHVDEIGSILKAADLFVMPSRAEGFSLALIEAMEAGLPCVSTRVGIAEDVIVDGITGLLVDRGDKDGLERALLRTIQDGALLRRLTRNVVVPACIPTLEEYAESCARDYEFGLASD